MTQEEPKNIGHFLIPDSFLLKYKVIRLNAGSILTTVSWPKNLVEFFCEMLDTIGITQAENGFKVLQTE